MCLKFLLDLIKKPIVDGQEISTIEEQQQIKEQTVQQTKGQNVQQILSQQPTLTKEFEFIEVKGFENYVKTITKKNKIIIHGTAGGTATGAITWMKGGGQKHVATHFVIGQKGQIYRLFPEEYFAYHAGANFRQLSMNSFGIQIVNWLNLQIKGNQYFTWTGKKIPKEQVYLANKVWRGYKAFQKITQKQHQSLQVLLKYLCQKYDIKKTFYRQYNPQQYIDPKFNGIIQHSSFHLSKMDFEPQLLPRIKI